MPLPYNRIVLSLVLLLFLQTLTDSKLREGLQALQHGDIAGARLSLENASGVEPGNAIVWAALAQVYLKLDRRADAMQAAEKAEKLGGQTPSIQHALAMFYSGAGEPAKAAGFEKQFAASATADADALFRAASLYLQAGDANGAIETAQAALKQKDSAALHSMLGSAYAGAKQQARALEEYRMAARLEPANAEYCFELATALYPLDLFTEAARVLETCAKASPENRQIELALGVAYYGLRRFPEAIEAFLKTIALAPDVEQPYLFLGKMLDQAGDSLPRIRASFEQFRSRHPESYLGSLLAAKALLLEGGKPEQIEPLLRETVGKNPTLWEPHADLADLLSSKRDYSGAAKELETAEKLNPFEASVPFRLARVYDRLGQPDKAVLQRARHRELLSQPKAGMSEPPR